MEQWSGKTPLTAPLDRGLSGTERLIVVGTQRGHFHSGHGSRPSSWLAPPPALLRAWEAEPSQDRWTRQTHMVLGPTGTAFVSMHREGLFERCFLGGVREGQGTGKMINASGD